MGSKEQMESIPTIRIAVKSAVAEMPPGTILPGFRRDKTLQPILTALREGILNGSPETKEIAAYGLSEVRDSGFFSLLFLKLVFFRQW